MDLNSTSSSPIPPRPPDPLEEFNRFVKTAAGEGTTAKGPQTLKAWLDLAESYRITQALRQCRGNRSAAARLLGIGRRTLYAKMNKLGLVTSLKAS
jgi:DNA-binding NtrC family response regulator